MWLTAPTLTATQGMTVAASGVIAGWLGYVMLRGWFEPQGIDLISWHSMAAFLFLAEFAFFPDGTNVSWQGPPGRADRRHGMCLPALRPFAGQGQNRGISQM